MVWVSSMFFLIATWLDHKVCTCWDIFVLYIWTFWLKIPFEWVDRGPDPCSHRLYVGSSVCHVPFFTCKHMHEPLNPFFFGKFFLKVCSLNLLIGFPLCLCECGSWALLVNVVSCLISFLFLLYLFVILRDSLWLFAVYLNI